MSDILSLDVYGRDFSAVVLQKPARTGKGKTDCSCGSRKPALAGDSQKTTRVEPYYVIWAGMVRNTIKKEHLELANSGRVLSLEDPVFKKIINPYRTVCGIDSMPPALSDQFENRFSSGEWVLDEERCVLDKWGLGSLLFKLNIIQKEEPVFDSENIHL